MVLTNEEEVHDCLTKYVVHLDEMCLTDDVNH